MKYWMYKMGKGNSEGGVSRSADIVGRKRGAMRKVRKTCWIGTIGLVFVALLAQPAFADWGDGVQGGPFRLHPGVSFSVGYDSNLYFSSLQEGSVSQAPEGTVEPRLRIGTENPDVWNFSADVSVGWRQYLTGDTTVRGQSGLSAELKADLLLNEDGPASLRFSEQFVRSNETPNYRTAENFNRIYNRIGVMGGLHPGGRVLETYASYDFSLYRHSLFADLDRHTHHLGWRGQWSFLPRTAFTADVDYRLIRYDQPFLGSERIPDVTQRIRNVNSTPLRITGGLTGQITPRISLNLRGGYGWGFYEEGPDVRSWIAQAGAAYQFGRIDMNNRLRAGYEHGFRDSMVGNFYTFHRGLVGYEQGFVANRLRLGLEVTGQIRDYSELGVAVVQTEENTITISGLSDLLVGVGATSQFEIRRGWNVGLRYGFSSNFSEDQILIEGPAEDSFRDYQRHHVLLSTVLTY